MKFLGVRFPPGLKRQQVIGVLPPQGFVGIRVLLGKLEGGPGEGLGLPLLVETLEPGKKAAVLNGQTRRGRHLGQGLAAPEFSQ